MGTLGELGCSRGLGGPALSGSCKGLWDFPAAAGLKAQGGRAAEWEWERPMKMGLFFLFFWAGAPPSWRWAGLGPGSSLLVLTGTISFELSLN